MSILEVIRKVNACDLTDHLAFKCAGRQLGWVAHDFAEQLRPYETVFEFSGTELSISPALSSFDARSEAIAQVLEDLNGKGEVPGWRGELYPALPDHEEPPLFVLERAAASLFGLRSLGVHLMGYVGEGDKLRLWVATRSPFKPTGPGQRDALVGGGIAYGQDPFDTMIREAWEEAGFRPETVMGANPAGEVRFIYQGPQGIDQGLDYQFEVQLDEAVKPENQDGEVAGFELLPIRQVMAEVAAGSNFEPGYLYDARLAFIAFFLRHGYIAGDDPDYLAIKNALLGKLD